MIQYPSEKITPTKSVLYDTFLSVDYAKASSSLSPQYSPNSLNMIRDEYGKIRRRMGYFEKFSFVGKIYGFTKHNDVFIVHAGLKLYKISGVTVTELYELPFVSIAQKTKFSEIDGNLFVHTRGLYGGMMGLEEALILIYDGATVKTISDLAYIPTLSISTTPSGSGTLYEQDNVIVADNSIYDFLKAKQSFKSDGVSVDYIVLHEIIGIDVIYYTTIVEGVPVTYELKNAVGDPITYIYSGKTVTFSSAPLYPAGLGSQDNVVIVYTYNPGYFFRIKSSKQMMTFGINGNNNQMFLSYENVVAWSAIDNPYYFPAQQYAVLGQSNSEIVSLNSFDNKLLAHKDSKDASTYICSIFIDTLNALPIPQLQVDRVIGSSGCVCRNGSQSFGEPIFITELGIQAVSYRDFTNTEVETMRGDRINRKLLQESGLREAVSCVWKYYYMLALNGNVYVLDRLNPTRERNILNNDFQYNSFVWNNIPATCFFADGDDLYFGTSTGSIMQFYNDESKTESYQDNGVTYEWSWEFPEYVGSRFYFNKSIKYIALRAKPYPQTTVTIEIQIEGLWYEVITDTVSFGYFDLSDLDLANLNLSTDTMPKKLTERYSQRKLDKFAFRIKGNTINQPFGLYSFAFEVKEKGKHK